MSSCSNTHSCLLSAHQNAPLTSASSILGLFLALGSRLFHIDTTKQFQRPKNHMVTGMAKLLRNTFSLPSRSAAVIKYSDKANLKQRGFILTHISREQSVISEKPWRQECRVTGHIPSRVKKMRGAEVCAQLPFFSNTLESQPRE